MHQKSLNIAIIGTGVVGTSFIDQLLSIKSHIIYNVILIARSKSALISGDYKPLNFGDSWKKSLDAATTSPLDLIELLEYLRQSPLPTILVDNTSDENIANFYPNFVKAGISIATPNKKAFSSSLSLWNDIFCQGSSNGLVYHEATVGAGLPIIGTLNDMIQTGDRIEVIEGIFSGTLSYIFNKYSTIEPNEVDFSDVVAMAKNLGYTEPDPRDDLNGLDVARKVIILARIAGFKIESTNSFPVESLIPKSLETIPSIDEFMQKLSTYDEDLRILKQKAISERKVLRFVGKINFIDNSVSVGIEKYSYSHPFASIKGSDNVISIKSQRYPNSLVIQGSGAGSDVTAAGVLADVIKISNIV